jgi:type I restriction enzyme S subunit
MIQYMENPGYPSLKLSTISRIPVALPSLPEQKRIATKIQELMQEVERARTACEKQLEAAKALPAAYLRQVFESEEAKKWERKRLGEVIDSTQSGTWGEGHSGAYDEDIFPVIRSTEINHKGLIVIDDKKVAKRRIKPEIAPKYFLQPKDLLIVRSGGTTGKIILGRVGIYLGEPNRYLFSNFLLKAQVNESQILAEFLWYYLNWDKFLADNIPNLMRRTTGIQNLPMDDYFSISIPLPSLETQHHIAAELKEKMAQVEKLRTSIEKQLDAINALPQAILRKAFRGEL